PPTAALTGAVEVKLIVWIALPTANDCCTCGAGLKLLLPLWFALILQVPTPMNETCEPLPLPLSAQADVALASIVNVVAKPDVAVAVTTCGAPPNVAPT